MSAFKPMTWDPDFFLLRCGNGAVIRQRRKERIILAAIFLLSTALPGLWLRQVTKYVPEPYLDEVFHIPQAQAYCKGEFGVWDPKLTTPPGLYLISALLIKLIAGYDCTALELRTINYIALVSLLVVAQSCRRYITGKPSGKPLNASKGIEVSTIDWDAVHTALNICLFPPLFFFSGLYYTDILSTCIVVIAYEHFWKRRSVSSRSVFTEAFTYLIGVMALLMRQTNIFWVAVFMGGLEITRTFKGKPFVFQWNEQSAWRGYLNDLFIVTRSGAFHDPKLENAGFIDYLLCASSLGATSISNIKITVRRLWPYILLLISFAVFVFWNGGVVLGDKSNHVATIHLPQMLYIWPFIGFFSLPLLYPSILGVVTSFQPLLTYWPENLLGVRRRPQVSTVVCLLGSIAVAIMIVRFNTIIHPFTLADNRHYVFYIFRYTIRQHPLVKYGLTLFYTIGGFLALQTLTGSSLEQSPGTAAGKATGSRIVRSGKPTLSDSETYSTGPNTSFALIWLISTALSLITAPLVEPRYFIIPWVIWRLHVPSLPLSTTLQKHEKDGKRQLKKARATSASRWAEWAKYWAYGGHDHRLWLETIWFLLISIITGYVFLFMGFEWPQEPDKVQRFMW